MWQAWPLPYTVEDELHSVFLYAQDCLSFARKFISFSGLQPQGPRTLPTEAALKSAARPLEQRTDEFNEGSVSIAGMRASWRRAGSPRPSSPSTCRTPKPAGWSWPCRCL